MTQESAILRCVLRDGLRSRLVPLYGLFFALAGWGMHRLSGDPDRVMLSLLSLSLALVPLVCLVYGASYLYQARGFIEWLLAQPVPRARLFLGLYLGLCLPLALAWVLGCAVPLLLLGSVSDPVALGLLLGTGVGLTLVFCAIAFLIAVAVDNRLRGLGLGITLWLVITVAWDGLILLGSYLFANYPLEGPVLTMCLANPVDLARILVLLHFDLGAMMGYTGAVFRTFFHGAMGGSVATAALALWVIAPLGLAWRIFSRRDF